MKKIKYVEKDASFFSLSIIFTLLLLILTLSGEHNIGSIYILLLYDIRFIVINRDCRVGRVVTVFS